MGELYNKIKDSLDADEDTMFFFEMQQILAEANAELTRLREENRELFNRVNDAFERGTEGCFGQIQDDGMIDPDDSEAGFWITYSDFETLKSFIKHKGGA